MHKDFNDNDLLFEASWEVCNKVGGIYTVLSTKANSLKQKLGDKLIFIGPDVWTEQNPAPDFLERKTLLDKAAAKIKLPYGITIRTGRWKVPGNPIAVLVKFSGVMEHLNDIFGEMWNDFGVDSLKEYGDYREACAFAIAAAEAALAIAKHLKANPADCIFHFDEWTTGMGLLWVKKHLPQAATVFTTHATSIGRSICGNGKPLYDYFDGYDGDQMARELNMEAKHSLEKTAAANADCFTTVSEVTAKECRQLLKVNPHVVTPNGFERGFIPTPEKQLKLRKKGREKLLKIASALTGRKWRDDTFIVATSGRNEYRNKGIDLFLDAIDMLRKSSPKKEILAFVLVPAWVKEPSGDLLFALNEHSDIHPNPDWLTHRLNNEDSDLINLRLKKMASEPASDNVKVIFVPCYLDGHDGIVDIAYYDLLPALDLTVFPSYYEPWGYTPLESIAFGVPTISSDKAGFGQWIIDNFNADKPSGAEVISRTDSNYAEDVKRVATLIENHAGMDSSQCSILGRAAAATAANADWKHFIKFYEEAYSKALHEADIRNA